MRTDGPRYSAVSAVLPALSRLLLLAALAVCGAPGARGEEDRSAPFDPAAIERLEFRPAQLRLGGDDQVRHFRLVAFDGQRLWDATHYARLQAADPSIVRLEPARALAVSDGVTELTAQVGGVEARAAVEVRGAGRFPPLHFENDIMPLFSKLGCNSGGCHGKQSGQNGFKLSVFGFDAAADYSALVHEARGRRLFPAAAEHSLLVRKATGQAPHGGGTRCEADSRDARLLVEWIGQGAPWGRGDAPQLSAVEIEPLELIASPRAAHQAIVTAVYSDGSRRDVTDAASYTSNAEAVASAAAAGQIRTGTRPGEAAITVNYRGQVGAVRVIVPRGDPLPPAEAADGGRIDQLVWDKLAKMGLPASPRCDDATFLRRLHLDVIGTLPAPQQVRQFLDSPDPDKRRQAVERVLQRDQYADFWALQWADILLVDRKALGDRGAYEFHKWLRRQFQENRPCDQWVRELITASGNSAKHGPVNLYRALRTPEELTRSVSQALLGVRIDCAQCHHHPFEKWSQEDFYGLAGFFNGLQRTALPDGRELVYHLGPQPQRLPQSDRLAPLRPPDGPVLEPSVGGDPRQFLAEWVTGRDNPWFSRVLANRLWKHFLGRGLVEPEDDLRSTNPAVNEPLLDYLADELARSGFDLQHMIRLIVSSRVYQLSSQPLAANRDDLQNYSHYYVKRLQAEVLLDAIGDVTGVPEEFAGMPPGVRAIQLWDNRLPSYFLDTFGRSLRESPCQCAKSSDPTMSQALHLMNAPEIDAKIRHRDGRLARLLAAGRSDEEMVAELCLAALGRPPEEKERAAAERLLAAADSRRQALEDLMWTLLNSYDFLFNQ